MESFLFSEASPLFFRRINVVVGAVISVPSARSFLDVLESICHGGLWSLAHLSALDSGSLVTCHFQRHIQSSSFL